MSLPGEVRSPANPEGSVGSPGGAHCEGAPGTRKRVVFVDDEPEVLAGLRVALRRQRKAWDMVFVEGGARALEELARTPADILVTDMRMPGMDGAELLARVRAAHPSITRVVLSGYSDRQAVLRTVGLAHQFVSKPCDGAVLRAVVERAFAVRSLLHDPELRQLLGSIDRLPSTPELYLQLTQLLSRDNAGAVEVARVIGRDPAMGARVLQLVNSAYFGTAQRITSIQQGVAYLGTELIRALVLCAHAFAVADGVRPVPGYNLRFIQSSSLVVARLASRMLATPQQKEDAFAAGLMRDLGKVVILAGLRGVAARLSQEAARDGVSCRVAEERQLKVNHAHLGAYLLGMWGLPFQVVEAVATHHVLGDGVGLDVCAAVHLASALVAEALPEPGLHAPPDDVVNTDSLRALGVESSLPTWRAWAAAEAAQVGKEQGP